MEPKASGRSRDGCITCKKRKKKCDGVRPECLTCQRLHLQCAGFKARLLFENDPIRNGIRRRGPPRKDRVAESDSQSTLKAPAIESESLSHSLPLSPTLQQPFPFPEQSDADALLWDSYINRFCKTYTTVTDNSSPFLSVIVPLAQRYEVVRHAVLAIAALQLDLSSRPDLHEALGSHRLQAQSTVSNYLDCVYQDGDMDQIMSIGTASVLLLIASKLSGQPYNVVRNHLKNIQHLTAQVSALNVFPRHAGSFKTKLLSFWKKMTSYTGLLADLVGARKTQTEMKDETDAFPLGKIDPSYQLIPSPRFETLVARINSYPEHVSSLDIDTWGGELDFMPSVTTTSTSTDLQLSFDANATDNALIREIYRTTLRIQHFKKLRDSISPTDTTIRHTYTTLAYPPFIAQSYITSLTRLQIQYMRQLSPQSRYDTSLLLPLGVTGPEVSRWEDRKWIIDKLTALEAKLGFPQLRKCQEQLIRQWGELDYGIQLDSIVGAAVEGLEAGKEVEGEEGLYVSDNEGLIFGAPAVSNRRPDVLLWG